jgi:hypothetical protein
MLRNKNNTLYKRNFYIRQRLLSTNLPNNHSPAIENITFRK